MRLDRASPCGPVWPCVALCGPVAGGRARPKRTVAEAGRGSGQPGARCGAEPREASGAPAGRCLSRLWFAPLLPLYYPLLAREQAPRASSRRPCASSCPRRRCSPPTTASRAMLARLPETVNSASVGLVAHSKFGFFSGEHRWVPYTPPPGTDEGGAASPICAGARKWTPQQSPVL